jgi:hypothetical protein
MVQSIANDNVKTLTPLEPKNSNSDRLVPFKFDNETEKLFKYYLNNCTVNQEDVQKRDRRNQLLKTMEVENTLIFLAVEMLSDESIQTQDSASIITVRSKSAKLRTKIYDLLKKWDINQNKLKSAFRNIYLFGDSFRYRKISTEGIDGFTWLDTNDVKRKIEFNPLKMDDYINARNNSQFNSMYTKFNSLSDLMNSIDSKDYSKLGGNLDSYLLGWELTNGQILPPWEVCHARLYTTESDFYPYGRSLFINSVSAFLQLKASKNLMIMARANNFPIEIYEIMNNENQTETEKWNALNRFVQNYNNITSTQTLAEQKGIKSSIYTMDGLFKYHTESPNFDLNQIADIEMLEMDLMRPTGIPLDLILGKGGSYSSGKLLSNQSLFFSRKIIAGHSALLESLIEDIKLHLYLIDDSEKDVEFELDMFSPQSEKTEEYFTTRKNTLELVTSIITNIKTSCGIEANVVLPKEVIINILNSYSFLSKSEIKEIVNSMYDSMESMPSDLGDEEDFINLNNDVKPEPQPKFSVPERYTLPFQKRMTESDIGKLSRVSKSLLNETYFEAKKELNMTEGFHGSRQFVMSTIETDSIKQSLQMIESHLNKDIKRKKRV